MSAARDRVVGVVAALGVVVVVVVVIIGALGAAPARAAETDPWWAWSHPPRDGTAALNAAVNARLQRGLDAVNASAASTATPTTCPAAARAMLQPLWPTALAFAVSDMQLWNVPHAPTSAAEIADVRAHGTYRSAPLLPLGWIVPLDPAVRVGDVLFGTDKLGHFFTNGPRYLDVYDAAVAAGASVDDAEVAAVRFGVEQERGWLGMAAAGIFSYGDLAANWRGMVFLRGLCAPSTTPPTPAAPRLVQVDGRWTLSPAFDIAAQVDPCWDEAWSPSAFDDVEAPPVQTALRAMCRTWRAPGVVERWQRYGRRACAPRHAAIVAALVRAGEAPDPRPFSLARICAEPAP